MFVSCGTCSCALVNELHDVLDDRIHLDSFPNFGNRNVVRQHVDDENMILQILVTLPFCFGAGLAWDGMPREIICWIVLAPYQLNGSLSLVFLMRAGASRFDLSIMVFKGSGSMKWQPCRNILKRGQPKSMATASRSNWPYSCSVLFKALLAMFTGL